jgi:hypothetical protein
VKNIFLFPAICEPPEANQYSFKVIRPRLAGDPQSPANKATKCNRHEAIGSITGSGNMFDVFSFCFSK